MGTCAKEDRLKKRHLRLRKVVRGTSQRPRLSVHRSHRNLFVQVVDDLAEQTLFSSSTLRVAPSQGTKKQCGNVEGSKAFGRLLAEELKKRDLTQVVFDRGGWPYHGRIQALAEALRENGIKL